MSIQEETSKAIRDMVNANTPAKLEETLTHALNLAHETAQLFGKHHVCAVFMRKQAERLAEGDFGLSSNTKAAFTVLAERCRAIGIKD